MWGPAIFPVGNPQDYAGKTWAGLYSSFYQPRQQLLMDMLGDAVEVAAAGGTTVDFATLAPSFTNASIQFEVAWGALGPGSAPNETFATKPSGDTFELAAAALATRGVPSPSTGRPLHYLGSWQLVPGKNPC